MAPKATIPPSKSPAESPYKLEPAQVLKASEALLKHMRETRKQNEENGNKRNLLTTGQDSDKESDDESGESEPVWLVVTTKKHIADQKTLKPKKIAIPHTLNVPSAISSICLLTAKPQRAFKDAIAATSFPEELRSKITVHGVDKVAARYKSFEQRRQLAAEHDVFLADDRIITMLPKMIGKALYGSTTKRPVPVSLTAPRPKDAEGKTVKAEKKILSNKRTRGEAEPEVSVANSEAFAREIERALSSALVHLSPSVTTSVRVGFSSFSGKQLAENIDAVITGMVDKIVSKGWRNIKSIHVKGPNTTSLPVWLASELWTEEEDVLEDNDAEQVKALASQKGRKRKGTTDHEESTKRTDKKQKQLEGISSGKDVNYSQEMTERREKLRQQKREAKKMVATEA